ncbi:ATP-grasp peptide maturase system methyltransferase [Spiractinospora alimapuensis]|uniref:ATP-grasp peptide maturase system methyltransferase n=1 Tax=Spiractinospora alimapuensis TaxID=2820884 RepID=UPI001F15A5AA|nr:ATP-grasp peptide maturase system methyltransferase [Spiractinospora alimapuensis]QVQ50104.1 ATP-grasp peptide maturase system methyltransferase [Spiractinospora alimapuensis]
MGLDAELRAGLVRSLVDEGYVLDPAWRAAFEVVPRHVFTPGFYLRSDEISEGMPVWEPVTEAIDPKRWVTAAYSNKTLITQLDGVEEDWEAPRVRHGGVFTSSSTLPSVVATMWQDADIQDGHRVLEIGTGTGYSTAVACERLGSDLVTSVEIDDARLRQAIDGFNTCGYAPHVAVTDGLYGYWPYAPYDRIVAACSMRHVPGPLIAQTTLGGKILLTLTGWLGGHARVLLTVADGGEASGHLLPGAISFMPARTQAPPAFGNPAHWAALTVSAPQRPARHSPHRISGAPGTGFTQFLAQWATPTAQQITLDGQVHLIDPVTGSTAILTSHNDTWHVRQAGPTPLWDQIEAVLDAYDTAGQPDQTEFQIQVTPTHHHLHHPRMPPLTHAGA